MNMYGLPALRYATGGDVAAAYNRIFERAPDPEGFDYWVNQFAKQEGYNSLADVPTDVLFKSIGYAAAANDKANVDPGEVEAETAKYLNTGMNSSDLLALAKVTGSETSPEVKSAVDQIFSFTPPTTPVVSSGGETNTQPATQPTTQTDTSTAGTTPATTTKPEDLLNRLLYQPILGRPGDPGGLEFYRGQFLGPGDTTISPAERARFIEGAVGSGELTKRAADAYLGTIPGVPSFLRPDNNGVLNSINPYFLRTAAPTIATNATTGLPQLQGATSLIRGGAAPGVPAAPFAKGGDVEYGGSRALTPAELGSTFERKYGEGSYIDPKTGRPVEGLLLAAPERNVVFGEELRRREAEALANMTPAERERMMRALAIRQGRTGVDPYTGPGLPGILSAAASNRPDYYTYQFAEGGLAKAAQNLARRGRGGDSMLVHMAPEEVSGLRALARAQGNDLTINPRTGLPEAFSLKKLFRAASFVLPFIPIPGLFGMSSLLTRSILSGVAAGASAKGKFDFKQALGGGLRAYALGSLGEKMSGAATPGGTPTAPAPSVPDAAAVNPMAGATAPTPTITTPDGDISLASSYAGPRVPASLPGAPEYQFSVQGPDLGGAGVSVPKSLDAPFFPGDPSVVRPEGTSSFITPEGQGYGKALTSGTDIAMAGLGGLSIEEAAKEQRNYDIQAAAARREEEERQRRFEALARRTLGGVPFVAAQGGQVNLAKGGMTYMEAGGTTGPTGEPRVVQGTGDGMSDSVPATIEGVQEARLANDEFVIPADVVSDIGNGSSNAGAKKLYGMMDRVRKARHGTTKQPPEINAESMMPA